jgi:hypothetical protein
LKAVIALALLASACRGGECEEARNAAGKAVAAALPDLDERRANAEQALAAAVRTREDLKHWRLEWGDGLRKVRAEMGCIEGKDAARCCDRMRAWFTAHRKPAVTVENSRYFPSLVIWSRQLRRFPGREKDADAAVEAIESIQRLMANDDGGPEVPDQVAAQCELARHTLEQLAAVADVVPPQPVEVRAALDERATSARLAHDWLVALASGAPASAPKKPPPELGDASAAVARYQSSCHD